MSRLTPEWTRARTAIVAAVTILASGLVAAAKYEPFFVAPLFGAIGLLVVVVALAYEPFIGIAAGFVGAALLVAIKKATGTWVTETATASTIEIGCLILSGWCAGLAGEWLYRRRRRKVDDQPAFGTLGVLTIDLATTRLEEEIDRASRYQRPLAVLWMEVAVNGDGPVGADESGRVAGRTMEALLRINDVPFAESQTSLGAILPETTFPQGLRTASRIIEGLSGATVVSRASDRRINITDFTEFHIGIASFPDHAADPAGLLDAARRAARSRLPSSSRLEIGTKGAGRV